MILHLCMKPTSRTRSAQADVLGMRMPAWLSSVELIAVQRSRSIDDLGSAARFDWFSVALIDSIGELRDNHHLS